MMGDDRERRVHELNLRAAHAAHERFFSGANQLFQSVLGFAEVALKASGLLNGGAAVATLAFIGALLTSENVAPLDYSPLVDVLTVFGVGVLFSTLASGASYLAQMAYQDAHAEHELTWEFPYVTETPKARDKNRIGVSVHVVAVVLVALSYCAFGLGGLQFRAFAQSAFEVPISSSHSMIGEGVSPKREADSTPQMEPKMDTGTTNLVVAASSIAAALLGPIAAVLITLRWETIRRSREERQTLLQTLLATRGRPADPAYSWAIRTTPLHFSRNRSVVSAHSAYMDAVRLRVAVEHQASHDAEIGRRLGILISEMMKDIGYKGLTSEQIEAYTAQGLADREELLQRALESLPRIAISAKRSADAAEKMLARMPPPASGESA